MPGDKGRQLPRGAAGVAEEDRRWFEPGFSETFAGGSHRRRPPKPRTRGGNEIGKFRQKSALLPLARERRSSASLVVETSSCPRELWRTAVSRRQLARRMNYCGSTERHEVVVEMAERVRLSDRASRGSAGVAPAASGLEEEEEEARTATKAEVKVAYYGPVFLSSSSRSKESGSFFSLVGKVPAARPGGPGAASRRDPESVVLRTEATRIAKVERSPTKDNAKDDFYAIDTPEKRKSNVQDFLDLYEKTEAEVKNTSTKDVKARCNTQFKTTSLKENNQLCSYSSRDSKATNKTLALNSFSSNESDNKIKQFHSSAVPTLVDYHTDNRLWKNTAECEKAINQNSHHRQVARLKNWKGLSVKVMADSSDSSSSEFSDHDNSPTVNDDIADSLENAVVSKNDALIITKRDNQQSSFFVVVAIDFGTTFSGYAFSFTRDPESIHMMRKWEGGDPGITNQKAPTTILLTSDGDFDSFGFSARDRYHDLDPVEAREWLFFEKFKMALHHNADLSKETMLEAANGKCVPAITVFSYALKFFKDHALQELSDQSGIKIMNEDVRWVITVPAIWKAPAKQFMRQAAYQATMVSPACPDQLIISLEPEAASIYCRKLRIYQLVPDTPLSHPLQSPTCLSPEPLNMEFACKDLVCGMRYMVVDCGGGTVDITVHELESCGKLIELYKATGGAYGATGVDLEFEKLLCVIFGKQFIENFKIERPAGWVDLMIAFESRKRSASPHRSSPLNISLPFSFIDFYKKCKKAHVESAVKKYGDKSVRWSDQGMLRLSPEAMLRLFLPTLDRIKQSIGEVLNNPSARNLKYLFLVGGFAESQILQHEIRKEFGIILTVVIPQGVGLTIVKGAVLYGLDPSVVNVRRARLTYGVGVLNRFDPEKHPKEKLFTKDGIDWCAGVFDKFVIMNQPVSSGDTVTRCYTPAKAGQKVSIINIYCTDKDDVQFITDHSVRKCGTLSLSLIDDHPISPSRREIQTIMSFGDTEIKMKALDVITGKHVNATIDFLDS